VSDLTTATLQEYDRNFVWHPFTQMQEWQNGIHPVIVRGEGSWLIDSDNNRYLDGVANLWTNVHGHCHPVINAAVKQQLDKIEHSTLLGLAGEQPAILAQRLVEIAPEGLCKVFYSDNGSTAVEIGIKMAFQYWQHRGRPQKTRFISLKNAYHGDTIGAVSVGGIDLFHEVFRPLLFPTIQAPSTCCYCCELSAAKNCNRCNMECLLELEKLMAAHAGDVAGFVIEPLLQGAGGMIVQPPGYLRRVRELCDRYEILLITDEVAVGFGRTGKMFACEHEGVTPDIMALSKGITGGYLPLAATMTTIEVYNAFLGEYHELKTFFHGHTFTGSPLACAAAIASLDLFASTRLLDSLPCKISYIQVRLAALLELDVVGDVRQCGMAAGIELVKGESGEPYAWEERIGIQVCLEARKHSLFLRPLGNVIVVFPPLAITMAELTLLMDGIEKSIIAVCGQRG
jgi:adenosylmethionine-8-amino-7-oxononanoate aminotransferase